MQAFNWGGTNSFTILTETIRQPRFASLYLTNVSTKLQNKKIKI